MTPRLQFLTVAAANLAFSAGTPLPALGLDALFRLMGPGPRDTLMSVIAIALELGLVVINVVAARLFARALPTTSGAAKLESALFIALSGIAALFALGVAVLFAFLWANGD